MTQYSRTCRIEALVSNSWESCAKHGHFCASQHCLRVDTEGGKQDQQPQAEDACLELSRQAKDERAHKSKQTRIPCHLQFQSQSMRKGETSSHKD